MIHYSFGYWLREQRAKREGIPGKRGDFRRDSIVHWSWPLSADALEPMRIMEVFAYQKPKLNRRGLPFDRSDLKPKEVAP